MMQEMEDAMRKAFDLRQKEGGPGIPQYGPGTREATRYHCADSAEKLFYVLLDWREPYSADAPYYMARRAADMGDWEWIVKRYEEVKEFCEKYVRRVVPGERIPDEWPLSDLYRVLRELLTEAKTGGASLFKPPTGEIARRIKEMRL
jgi:hypothetical protein